MLGFLRGKSGELRVGYQTAARLGNWSARRESAAFILDAEVIEADSYWLGKTPAVASLWVGSHRWRFDADSISNSGNRVQARLHLQK